MNEELQQIMQRLDAIEESDRLQTQRLTLIRRVQLASAAVMALGLLLGIGVINDENNRALLERLAVGAIAASVTGLIGSEFLDKR